MIIGIGNDLCAIPRVQRVYNRFGHKFARRLLSDSELSRLDSIKTKDGKSAYLARRFAAKEAIVKAVGTGISHTVSWHDISVTNNDAGQPVATLNGGLEQRLKQKLPSGGNYAIHVSLSDDGHYAQAFALIESMP